jgi:hypothetical protein
MLIICLVTSQPWQMRNSIWFYNGMPGHWRIRHAISGQSAHTTTHAKLLHYFRVQEHEQLSNEKKLKLILGCTKLYSYCTEHQTKKFAGHFKGKQAEQVNKAGGLSNRTSGPAKHKKSRAVAIMSA